MARCWGKQGKLTSMIRGQEAELTPQVIVTSYLFPDGKFALDRLEALEKKVGKEKLIVDISCRRREDGWVVAMNGWKTLTDMWVTKGEFPSTMAI